MRKASVIFVCILTACSGSGENSFILESVEIHNATIKISEEVVLSIKKMNTLLDDLEEDESFLKDSLAVLKQDFIDWESSIVEIPGHELNQHDHPGHDHEHDHSPPPDLTPEMMLDVQKDLRDRIVKLNIRAQKLLNTLEKGNIHGPL